MKIIATNRKAKFNYQITDSLETGIVLKGDEIKSLRLSGCSINESFAKVEKSEIFLYNMHIKEFEQASFFKSDVKRARKLLLHKREILRLSNLVAQKGSTLIPVKVYFNQRGYVKISLGVAKGKKLYDKRRKIKEEYTNRDVERQLKAYRLG